MTEYLPSHFASLGKPFCSRWGKSEIERIALAYVQALANDGDTWKKLSKEQTYQLLSDEQKRATHAVLTGSYYDEWFNRVSDLITDSDGALSVGGYWNEYRLEKLISGALES